jgi:hypothetical protein
VESLRILMALSRDRRLDSAGGLTVAGVGSYGIVILPF